MEVTVTGVGMVSALGLGVESGVASISRGESGISPAPEILRTINKLPVGEVRLTNEELHDVLHIRQREHLSRTALLGIWAAREAIADAGIDASGSRVGLVSSTSVGGMDRTERFFETFVADEKAGRLRDVKMHDCAASTEAIAHHCGIGGYRTTVSTACSSAANAIMHGAKLIRHGILDAVIVGGCDALSAFTLNGFKSLMILDEAVCRPFDESRAGLNLGEGAGYIVLQREEERTEGYCNLTGYANRNDAYHQTASSESGEGAYRAMSEALAMAGIGTDDVSYINVHGTGTKNNDCSEGAAMVRLFGKQMPPFSSTKAFTGHTLAAAGGIEAVLSAVAIKRGVLYPNLNFQTPIAELGLKPVTRWTENVEIDSVMSNSFGFGGNCSSLIFSRQRR